ncbi:MAG: M14 family metallopeptidase [Burkholderiales bacterium]|jgi:predicted deacylase|nr:M14 family metallopeptidase [Burkholderiales bacterium]
MREERLPLPAAAPGTAHQLTVLRYGPPAARPKAYLHAALHADELPGIVVLHHLRQTLAQLEEAGRLRGEVVAVPYANPLGLGQRLLGTPIGRFSLADGGNFNRHFPDLFGAVLPLVRDHLSTEADANVALIRQAAKDALAATEAPTVEQQLKRTLLALALDADLVLDLHCDGEALLHGYTLTDLAPAFDPLARLLGLRALLLADESGDTPFDEACSRLWLQLRQALPQHPIPLACAAATLELRGEANVAHDWGAADAQAIVSFLALRGLIDAPAPALPAAEYAPTALAASEPIHVAQPGVIVFTRPLGATLAPGDVLADVIDPDSGRATPVATRAGGLLYARCANRLAWPGKRIAKVAGTTLQRTGKLLSP